MKTSDNYRHPAPSCANCKYGFYWAEKWFCIRGKSLNTTIPIGAVKKTWLAIADAVGITYPVRQEAYENADNFVGYGGGVCDKYEPLTEESDAHENN